MDKLEYGHLTKWRHLTEGSVLLFNTSYEYGDYDKKNFLSWYLFYLKTYLGPFLSLCYMHFCVLLSAAIKITGGGDMMLMMIF